MAKFKKGDRVRAIGRWYTTLVSGSTARIESVEGVGLHITWLDGPYSKGDPKDGPYMIDNFELVEPTKPQKFKVGDRVRAIGEWRDASVRGSTARVTKVTTDSVDIDWGNEGYKGLDGSYGYDRFELVIEEPKHQYRYEPMATKVTYPGVDLGYQQVLTTSTWPEVMRNDTTTKKETPEMSFVNKLKESKLNPDERVLRKAGLRDEEGWTNYAVDALNEILLDENRDKLVAEAKRQAKEAKEEKASK